MVAGRGGQHRDLKGKKRWLGQARGTAIGRFSPVRIPARMAMSSVVHGLRHRVHPVHQIHRRLCQAMTLSLGLGAEALVLTTATRRGGSSPKAGDRRERVATRFTSTLRSRQTVVEARLYAPPLSLG
jgi:hypothetical protein